MEVYVSWTLWKCSLTTQISDIKSHGSTCLENRPHADNHLCLTMALISCRMSAYYLHHSVCVTIFALCLGATRGSDMSMTNKSNKKLCKNTRCCNRNPENGSKQGVRDSKATLTKAPH